VKLQQPLSGDYNPATKTLTLSGKNKTTGRSSKIDFDVEDANVFLGWLAAVLFEKKWQPDGRGAGLVANSIAIGLHQDQQNDGHDLSFAFAVGDMRLAFVLPVQTKSPEKLSAIKAHIEQALAEMGDANIPTKQ
jgi:hypothetical protein